MDERIGYGHYQSCGNRGVLDVCLCLGCGGLGGVGRVGGWLVTGSGRVGVVMYVCVCCKSGLFVWMTDPGICILC